MPPIAFYFYSLTRAGGAERMVCQLANFAAERGVELHLISLDAASDQSFYQISEKVIWHKLGVRGGLSDKIRRVRALVRILTENKVRSLAGFVISGDKTVFAAAKLAGVRLIVAERNAPSMYAIRYGRSYRWQAFALLHLADKIVVQQDEFVAGYPRSLRERIKTIANPVPRAAGLASPSRADESGRYTLLCVSRLDSAQKGLHTLVHAFAKVAARFSDWDLRLIGDGPEKEALHTVIDALGLNAQISIETPREDIFSVYQKAHLFCMPSLWEGFPNALAEAMAHGLPAVGFREAMGVRELIGEAGWLASGLDDPNALAAVLVEAMADNAGRAAKGKSAVEAMQLFGKDKQSELWLELLAT